MSKDADLRIEKPGTDVNQRTKPCPVKRSRVGIPAESYEKIASNDRGGKRMEDARETRRKRLMERKTDRLAFITGQNPTLMQSAPQDATYGENTNAMEVPKFYHSEGIVSNTLDDSGKQESALKSDTNQLHKLEVEIESPEVAANYVSREQKNEVACSRGENISGQLFTTSMHKKPEGHDGPRPSNESQNGVFTIFTPTNISHSVPATENIRLLFTFVVAVLGVSLYNGFMIGGRLVSSIICFRPLFLVLLTDVMIILGWVFLNQGICQKPENDARKAMQEDEGWSNDSSNILEIGQVLRKVLGAAFMDCSICALFLICGIVV